MDILLIALGVLVTVNAVICYSALCIASEEDRWLEEHGKCSEEIAQKDN